MLYGLIKIVVVVVRVKGRTRRHCLFLPFNNNNSTPSPERPRKQSTILHRSLKQDREGNRNGGREGASY
jgi:hypothetical protein